MNLDYVRVTDAEQETGNAWTTLREVAEADGLTVLDGELATDERTGRPLPPSRVEKPAVQVAEPAAPATDSEPAAEPGGKPTKPTRNTTVAAEPATGK